MENKTELIASWKLVDTENGSKYVVTTVNNNVVWVPKSQFDTNAEQITFTPMKKGDKFTNTKTGEEGVLKADRNEFQGCGKQIVKKFNSQEIIDHLLAKGITPTFSLS